MVRPSRRRAQQWWPRRQENPLSCGSSGFSDDGVAACCTAARHAQRRRLAHWIQRKAMETSSFSPTHFLSFLRALIDVKTSFLEEETISSFYTLSFH
jgi:NAD-dependent DNA ligase